MNPMLRRYLFEIADQSWFPHSLRDAMTDYVRWSSTLLRVYQAVAPRLRIALSETGARRIVDLCSGAGGPWSGLLAELEQYSPHPLEVLLTDIHPNLAALEWIQLKSNGRLSYVKEPVDATDVPEQLDGFRTMFSAFHHFSPEQARKILQDAVSKNQGIGIFDLGPLHVLELAGLLAVGPVVWLTSPLLRPFRPSRLFWTYVVPVLPAALTFDNAMSFLRLYSPRELSSLTAEVGGADYHWEVGHERASVVTPANTYIIGYPRRGGRPDKARMSFQGSGT